MRFPPLPVVASWPNPNYDHPTTRGPALIVVNVVFMILVLIAVAGRFYARIAIRRWVGLDDYMCVPALVSLPTIRTMIIIALRLMEPP